VPAGDAAVHEQLLNRHIYPAGWTPPIASTTCRASTEFNLSSNSTSPIGFRSSETVPLTTSPRLSPEVSSAPASS
jgi:hypothetical protein